MGGGGRSSPLTAAKSRIALWNYRGCDTGYTPGGAQSTVEKFRPRAPEEINSIRETGEGRGSIRKLIEIQSPVERAFLVGAPRKGSDDAVHVDEHLEELERLADTAGAQVIGSAIQRIGAPTSNFCLGSGNGEEPKDTPAASGA